MTFLIASLQLYLESTTLTYVHDVNGIALVLLIPERPTVRSAASVTGLPLPNIVSRKSWALRVEEPIAPIRLMHIGREVCFGSTTCPRCQESEGIDHSNDGYVR
jgi:hypothetical protein